MFCSYVALAIRHRAAELAFAPQKDRLDVSYVVEGARSDLGAPHFYLVAAFIATVKAITGLDISDTRNHQQGRLDVRLPDGRVQVDVEVQPTQFGETVVLHFAWDEHGRACGRGRATFD
jgi:type II secretory ATPase GspE/PulE/Tfp pilus assembly ATPase PilB-like protein